MDDTDIFAVVRDAVIWAKSEVIELEPRQIRIDSVLAEPPIVLDSLEFVVMVTRIEESLGLVAEDEHIAPKSTRTVRDLVESVQRWIDSGDSTEN